MPATIDEHKVEDIIYIKELKSESYIVEISDIEQVDENEFVINFINKPKETIDINGSKTWNDNDNHGKMRPESITIRLFANGVEHSIKEVTASDNWKWSFNDLPKFDENNKLSEYTISEDKVEGYVTEINGFDITNSYTPVSKTGDNYKANVLAFLLILISTYIFILKKYFIIKKFNKYIILNKINY